MCYDRAMARMAQWLVLLLAASCSRLVAIENVATGTYNETAPTSGNIPNWQTGWTQPAVQPSGYTSTTGWNYVGTVAGSLSTASGVYLGNGWVITCAHVGPGTFKLNGTSYGYVPNSMRTFTTPLMVTTSSSSGTSTSTTNFQADFILFQISPAPALPVLPLRASDPVTYSSQVAMLGFGDGGPQTSETWGLDTIVAIDELLTPDGTALQSNDFLTLDGTNTFETSRNHFVTITDNYQVVGGDSGGAEFIYNSAQSRWELAGINEVNGTATTPTGTETFSGFVQLNNTTVSTSSTDTMTGVTTTSTGTLTYATQIAQLVSPVSSPVADTPTLPQWALIVLGGLLSGVAVMGSRRATCGGRRS